jgi:glycosyltransferase involved in cell wall biosynthesis
MKQLSIVIPIYNEEAILEQESEHIVAGMAAAFPDLDYELLLVENGSHDRTHQIAEELMKRHPRIRALHLPDAGYGPALKRGLLESAGEFVALFNIDFWDIQFIRKAFDLQKINGLDMVVGSKTMHGAEDTRPFVRRLITQTFNALLRGIFGFRGTDTHGMKLLRRDKMVPVIQACRTEREIFDTEFVMRAQAAGLKTEEIPVVCEEKRKTTYHIAKRIPRTAKDLLVLFFSLRLARANKFFALASALTIGFFLFAALRDFPDRPSPWFDQGVNLGIAKTFVQDGVYSLRLAPGVFVDNRPLMISTNYPALAPIIAVFALFGVGLAQAEIVMFLFLSSFLIAAYALLRRWYGARQALCGIALAVTFLPLYGNGMSGGLGEVPGLLYFFLALFFLKKEKPWQMILCGLLFGLAAATKVFYLTVLGAFGASELMRAFRMRRVPIRRWLFLALGTLPPLLIWLRTLLPAGLTPAGAAQALKYYGNPYDAANTIVPNVLRFVTETTPIHFALLAGAFFLMAIAAARRGQLRQGEFIITVFFALNIWFFLKTPGWYRYLFPAHLTALLFFPAALDRLAALVPRPRAKQFAVYACAALLAAQAIHFFRTMDTRLYVNPAPRAFAAALDEALPDEDMLVVDHPELWFLLRNRNARQFLHMNPYVAFGEDVAAAEIWPEYIISGETDRYDAAYARLGSYDSYVLFGKKR